MANYFPSFEKLIKGQRDSLLKNDRVNQKNKKMNNLTRDDLLLAGHRDGIGSLEEVDEAFFETDGKIILIPKSKSK